MFRHFPFTTIFCITGTLEFVNVEAGKIRIKIYNKDNGDTDSVTLCVDTNLADFFKDNKKLKELHNYYGHIMFSEEHKMFLYCYKVIASDGLEVFKDAKLGL